MLAAFQAHQRRLGVSYAHLVSIYYSYGVAIRNAGHAAFNISGMARQPKQKGKCGDGVFHWAILPAPTNRKPARSGFDQKFGRDA